MMKKVNRVEMVRTRVRDKSKDPIYPRHGSLPLFLHFIEFTALRSLERSHRISQHENTLVNDLVNLLKRTDNFPVNYFKGK